MTTHSLDEQKRALEAKRADIENQLKQFTVADAHAHDGHRSVFPDFGSHEDENANEVVTYENRIALEQNLEMTLDHIKDALTRIDNGTYGTCTQCGKKIDQKRLDVFPEAALCMSCQEKSVE